MAQERNDRATIREYLLGRLPDSQRQDFEQRLFSDETAFEELLVVEDELIDAYLKGELDAEQVGRFESIFLATSERQDKLRFGRAFMNYVSTQTADKPMAQIEPSATRSWTQLFGSPARVAAYALVILVVALGTWQLFFRPSDVDKGLIALNDAYRQQRPVEARISQLDYAPFPIMRGAEPEHFNTMARDRAERILLDAVHNKPGAESRHALGKLYLAKKDFDKAIAQFEEALKTDPSDAQIYADLGAALLEKAKAQIIGPEPGKGLEVLARSLEKFNRALELDGNLLEAFFNRALCFEEQMLWAQAEDAWKDYLGRDATSAWANEARRRLAEVEQRRQNSSRTKVELLNEFLEAYDRRDEETAWRLVTESYTSAGSSIANALISSFLSTEDQNEGRSTSLQALRYLAELELKRAQDFYHSDLSSFYDLLPKERRLKVNRVRKQMDDAFDSFTNSRSTNAINLYTSSQREFGRLGNSAEAIFAEYRIAHSYAIQPNMEKSREIFFRVRSDSEKHRYRWLAGQSLLGLAHVSLGFNQYSEAIEFSKRGLALFKNTGYTDGLLHALTQLADEYQAINRIPESLELLQQSLAVVSNHFADPLVRWGLYTTVAFNLESLGLHNATIAYQMEALMIALDLQRPLIASRSYAYLGTTYGKLKNFPEAIKNLRQAYETGLALADDLSAIEMMANSSLQLGDLYRMTGATAKALESYDQCLNLYHKLGIQYFSYAAHRGKLLTYVSLQDDSATAQELETILSSLEQYRSSIRDETQRNSFFETQQGVYDTAISFAYDRKHDPHAAFEYSEMSRARSLLDSLQEPGQIVGGDTPDLRLPTVASSVPLSDLRELIPEQAQLLQYAVLDNKLIIWLITSKDFTARETEIGAEELAKQVRSYLDSIAKNHEVDRGSNLEKAKHLYNILLGPVESLLDKNRLLCIVPDKILSYLPFGALVSPESNRYIIEDYVLELSPSASVFVNASRTGARREQIDEEKLLAVGNPSFDKVAFPHLQDLGAAKREAQSISSYYNSSKTLLEENAREHLIKEGIRNFDVVHLALHYLVNERSEMLSKLVLAKESNGNGQDGELHAYEIYQMRLPRTRLAVLSACQTGIDRNFAGEGAVSIARPFLAAGVTLVVASLWPVDSNSTSELMIQFHRHRKLEGHSTIKALRLAQLDLLRSEDTRFQQPYHWASFVVMGGYASF